MVSVYAQSPFKNVFFFVFFKEINLTKGFLLQIRFQGSLLYKASMFYSETSAKSGGYLK